jgi:hypothetical protein
MVDPVATGPGVGAKITTFILIGLGFAIMIANIILMSLNLGTENTNQGIRKYVGLSIVPVSISLILLAVGLKMYFTANPSYLPYAAVILALLAIGISNISLCVSLIHKEFS